MKLHRYILAIAALGALLGGCQKPLPEPGDSSLTLHTTEVEASAEGGSYTVEYTLKNPVEGGKLLVTAEHDWVRNISVAEAGRITFEVAPSYEAAERSCRLDVAYTGIYPNPTIVVRQAKGMSHAISFKLNEVNATNIKMDVLPEDKNLSYVFILGNGKYIEENGLMEDDEALWASDMEIFQGFADAFGVDVKAAMTAFMYQGELINHTFTGVTPGTTYVAYAYGFDVETMTPTTEVCRIKIETKHIDDYVVDFDFKVDVAGPNVVIDINAVGYDGPFFFGVFDAKSCPESTPDAEFRDYCEAAWEQEKGTYSAFFDSPEQGVHFVLNELAYYKNAHIEVELMANTDYVLWAFGMDSEALLNTTPERYYFSTGDVAPSENQFTLKVSDIMSRKATVTVETTNDDSYVAMLGTPERYTGLSDEQIITYITSNYQLNYNNGTMSQVATGLTPSTEYVLYVFGCEAGGATTALSKLHFTTAEVVYSDLEFEIKIGPHYDINEVIELNPNWASYAGDYCIVTLDTTVDPAAVNYYYSVFYSDQIESYDYEYILAGLLAEGAASESNMVYVLEYDKAHTFFGLAEDSDGNFTELWLSKPTTFKYSDRSDAKEFVEATTQALRSSMVYDLEPRSMSAIIL